MVPTSQSATSHEAWGATLLRVANRPNPKNARRRTLRAVLAAWAAFLGCQGCTRSPQELLDATRQALHTQNLEALEPLIHPRYSDPVGDRARLLRDIKDLYQDFPRLVLRFEEVEILGGSSKSQATVLGKLNGTFFGSPEWSVLASLRLELERDFGFRIRSGLLQGFRSVRALAEKRRSALEANDAQAMKPLLHPAYRDGDLDADEAVARLAHDIEGVRIRHRPLHYRLEIRGPDAQLDERYELRLNQESPKTQVARLRLKRSAGLWRIQGGLYPAER